jgi:hypothetical protein
MAWTATLTGATQNGMDAILDVRIVDGAETLDIVLTYSLVDPHVTPERIKSDITHYAKSIGKWPYIQSKIGQVIATG